MWAPAVALRRWLRMPDSPGSRGVWRILSTMTQRFGGYDEKKESRNGQYP